MLVHSLYHSSETNHCCSTTNAPQTKCIYLHICASPIESQVKFPPSSIQKKRLPKGDKRRSEYRIRVTLTFYRQKYELPTLEINVESTNIWHWGWSYAKKALVGVLIQYITLSTSELFSNGIRG